MLKFMYELFPLYHPPQQMEVYFQQIINALTNVPQLTTNKCKQKQKKYLHSFSFKF
jgi:hypothetical protein